MPPFSFDGIQKLVTRGVIAEIGPTLLKGALLELFRSGKIDTNLLIDYVSRDVNLWEMLDLKYRQYIRNAGGRLGNLNWLTSQFLIDAVREEFPAVASLFLGWEQAGSWLDSQIEDVKYQVQQSDA